MKPLVPLSPAARSLLELGSQVEPPTADQNERMARTLAPLLAASLCSPPAIGSGGVLPEAIAAPRSLAGSHRLLLGSSAKLLVAAGAVAATTIASFCLGRMSSQVEPRAVAGTAAPVALAQPMPPRVPTEPPGVPLPAKPELALTLPSAGVAPRDLALRNEASAPAPRSTARSRGLAEDIERLARADAALRQGHPGKALQLLEQPVVRELREQAAALGAIAACAAGVARPTRPENALRERWLGSPYEARVREACGP